VKATAYDSVHAQFSDSVTAPGGAAIYRIGTTSSAPYSLEDCVSCGVSAWGWQDNSGAPQPSPIVGPHIYFASSGPHTIRIQTREDGLAIDQIVLSATTYLNTSPGPVKDDSTILNRTETEDESSQDVVIYASEISTAFGAWAHAADTSAAFNTKLHHPDAGGAKLVTPLANPIDYFEATFTAQAGIPYHLWMRGKAERNSYMNDSAHVQFSDSVAAPGGAPVYRINTTDSTVYSLEDCTSCGLSNWGWQDNGFPDIGPDIYFETSGTHTIRIQTREDGLAIDQIVLSPAAYLTTEPGPPKDDTTIIAPHNQAPQVPNFGATPTSGVEPVTVTFSVTATDPEGGPLSYLWEFGDGTSSTEEDPTHTYSRGQFTAKLTVRDQNGATAIRTQDISVDPGSVPITSVIKVLQWNVTDGEQPSEISMIVAQNPDIVFLQELDRTIQLDKIEAALEADQGVEWNVKKISKYNGTSDGSWIVIMARFELSDDATIQLSHDGSVVCDGVPVTTAARTAIGARINVDDKPFAVFSTRNFYKDGDCVARDQNRKFKEWAQTRYPNVTHLYGGDFNMIPGGQAYRVMSAEAPTFTDAWEEARADGHATAVDDPTPDFNTGTKANRLDYLFYRNASVTKLSTDSAHITTLANPPSDHRMMIATFTVEP
jgi:PKD repeat protein